MSGYHSINGMQENFKIFMYCKRANEPEAGNVSIISGPRSIYLPVLTPCHPSAFFNLFLVYFLALHLQCPQPAPRRVAFLTSLNEPAPSSMAFLISAFVTLKQGHMYVSFPITAPGRERCKPLKPVRSPACRVPWGRGRTGRSVS